MEPLPATAAPETPLTANNPAPPISTPPVAVTSSLPWLKISASILLIILIGVGIFFFARQLLDKSQPSPIPPAESSMIQKTSDSIVTPTATPNPTPDPDTSISAEFQELESLDTTLPTDDSLNDPLIISP